MQMHMQRTGVSLSGTWSWHVQRNGVSLSGTWSWHVRNSAYYALAQAPSKLLTGVCVRVCACVCVCVRVCVRAVQLCTRQRQQACVATQGRD